jgi:hypothetical protein
MTLTEIANLLGVNETFLYSLAKAYPVEVPKHLEDLESWSDFVYRHKRQAIIDGGSPRSRSC